MERTKLLTLAVLGLLLVNLLTIGFLIFRSDQSPHKDQMQGPQPDDKGPSRLIIARLHFDEQQQKQYLDLVRQHKQQTMQLNTKSIRLFQSYYGLLTQVHPDSTKSSLVRQIADVQQQIAELNFSHFQQIKSLCRSDQQADFAKLVTDLARLFGQRQRPPHSHGEGPPDDRPGGPPENFPPPPRN
ncbi:periplasmic heavy metal sensor [Spirosoma foliorum]|uniref:Periplasmic heavy metal sensor n=1 Tax=Spirosoma foliorum TaxID=2710596 RepID=A0A7G5GT44_9BACT|nr:periplasmic heavy metal sensor [Spirosoma foliorum]QMW02036.1 periplasmic heavy metal sensor [Spirosoma foliorum]